MQQPQFKTETARELHAVFQKFVLEGHSLDTVFDDFVQLTVYGLSPSPNPLLVNQVIQKWPLRSGELFEDSLQSLFLKAIVMLDRGMEREQSDILGDYFETVRMGEKSKGQNLTGYRLVDLSNGLTLPESRETKSTILDPCCGSGRFLLSAGRSHPACFLIGVDIDLRMANMCAVNLAMQELRGVVICADLFDVDFENTESTTYSCPISRK